MRDPTCADFQADTICIPDNASNVAAAEWAVDAFCFITSSTDTLTVPQCMCCNMAAVDVADDDVRAGVDVTALAS